jgi:hypothetical protein
MVRDLGSKLQAYRGVEPSLDAARTSARATSPVYQPNHTNVDRKYPIIRRHLKGGRPKNLQ